MSPLLPNPRCSLSRRLIQSVVPVAVIVLAFSGCVVVAESSEVAAPPTPSVSPAPTPAGASASSPRPVLVAPPARATPVETGPAVSGDHVIFFTEPNFRGDSFIVETGASVEDLRDLPLRSGSWNKTISSFRIQGIATVVAYTESDFRGQRIEISSSVADLVTERRGAGPEVNWDNTISSLRALAPRTRSFDATPRYDRRTAENVVQRAFRDLLGREPDADGLRSYRERLIDDGWSEDDVRNDIRRSREFRAIKPEDVITKAYRELLKRDPDEEGMRHYRDLLVNRGWTIPQLRADILRSNEWTDQRVRAVITKAYRDLLGRDPDPDGFANYAKAIRDKGWDEKRLRDEIARSPEARARKTK